jgi:hypothetical protein
MFNLEIMRKNKWYWNFYVLVYNKTLAFGIYCGTQALKKGVINGIPRIFTESRLFWNLW